MNELARVPAPDPAILRAVEVLRATQHARGSWKGDYSGPLFLPPLLVFTWHLVEHEPTEAQREGLVRYLQGTANRDGGWGLGIEGPSCVFTTALNLAALRLLDVPADDPGLVRARFWLRAHGGPLAAASWGKFFLALVGLYDWEGLHPIPPELWLLPRQAPVHPGRMWCHARMVYLPMSWLYGRRATGRITPRILELREELYGGAWDGIRWRDHRDRVARVDAHTPRTPELRVVHALLGLAERWMPPRLRERALGEVLHQIRYEDEVTDHLCIGPVNKLLDTLVWHCVDPGGPRVRRHLERLETYLVDDHQGTRMNGYDSSELWDTAFACQALALAAPDQGADVLARAGAYVHAQQVLEDPPDRRAHYRARSEGAWPFSTREHGWPITDCTAEGLLACLALEEAGQEPLSHDRLALAVERLLGWQNPDGGWASYERTRGPAWLERLNPSDAFGAIMIDHTHTECTAACVTALSAWRDRAPGDARVDQALARGVACLRRLQGPDGGWRGGWGVCFTYGTWFAVRGLRAAGVPVSDPAITRAVAYLEGIQLRDGGWGERLESCRLGRSVPTAGGQAVMTSWALLALAAAGRADGVAARRGEAFLRGRQLPDGRWPEEHVAGVFNQTCAIHYDAYLEVFPPWALAALQRAREHGAEP